MIQRAIKRNPRAPDLEGLDEYMANPLDTQGGGAMLESGKHVTEIQKVEPQIPKQQRRAREEADSL